MVLFSFHPENLKTFRKLTGERAFRFTVFWDIIGNFWIYNDAQAFVLKQAG